jgi:putative FmdB family regulatory protein
MPIYAFECGSCGHAFDRLQKLSDPDPETCPACGAAQIRRQLTAPSFRLAGSGWYETDFKKDGDKKRNLADSGGNEAPKADAPKTDTKPAESKPAESKSSESKPATPAPPSSAPGAAS